MKMKQHPLSATFPLPNSSAVDFLFDGGRWMANTDQFLIEIYPSKQAGYWFASFIQKNGWTQITMVKPMLRWGIEMTVDHEVGISGEDLAHLNWERFTYRVEDPVEPLSQNKEVVYFIQAGEFVKIGFTNNLAQRIDSFRCGCPYEIHLLCLIEGGAKKESDMHKRFAHWRYRGEWFHLSDEIKMFIVEFNK